MLFDRDVLPNGVRVLSERMPEVRSVTLGFWVGVGSRDEPTEAQGSSHFLEHLLFKGTERRSAQDIAEAFDAVGGEANAFSAKEYTCYYGRVLDEDLPMAAEILTDILTAPAFSDEDVESERSVILEEIAMHEDSPEDLVHDLFAETLFGTHPLAREVMGTTSTVASITPGSLRDFHLDNYHGSNIVVAATGNVAHQQVVDLAGSVFSSSDQPSRSRVPELVEPMSSLRVLHRTTEQAHIVLGGLGYPRQHPARFAWGVLDNLLGGGMSSRLFQEIREKRGLAYAVYSYRSTYGETGAWAVYAGTTPGRAVQVLDLIHGEIDRLLEKGISEEELTRAKGHMRGGVVLGLEDPSSRMTRLGKSELVHGEILSIDNIIERIDAVTLEDVARVAADLLAPEKRILSVIGPFAVEDFAGLAQAG